MEKTLNLASYKCRILQHKAAGIPIIFLHGMSYTNEIWQKIGLIDILLQKNIPFLALNMPYGIKSQCQPKTRNTEKNLTYVNEAVKTILKSEIPIMVGASIGGNISLEYAARFPVKGLFLIGPVRTLEPSLIESYKTFRFPTSIVFGSEDNIVASEDMRTLTNKLPNSKLIIYEGAGHSAYKDEPNRFKKDLLELYANAEQP